MFRVPYFVLRVLSVMFRVAGPGIRYPGFGSHVPNFISSVSESDLLRQCIHFARLFVLRVSIFGASGIGFRDPGSGFRVKGFDLVRQGIDRARHEHLSSQGLDRIRCRFPFGVWGLGFRV